MKFIQTGKDNPSAYKAGIWPRVTIQLIEKRYELYGDATRSKGITVVGAKLEEVMNELCSALGLVSPFSPKKKRKTGRWCRFCDVEMIPRRRRDMQGTFWFHPWGTAKTCPLGRYERRAVKRPDAERFRDYPPDPKPQPRRRIML